MKKAFLLLLFLAINFGSYAQESMKSEVYTLVTYNVENLFDADGTAIYDDYNTTDKDGNPLYTKEDVLTKIQNAVRVLKEYNEGKGPDIAVIVELESDYSPNKGKSKWVDQDDFLAQYSTTTLKKMLGEEFNEEVADLPSELLLLKGMVDAGMWNYQLEVGNSPKDEKGLPTTVQKTAVFSRFQILREKTKIHPLERARPILETWIDVEGNELAVFANHWKSGASSWDMEQIRIKNAEVLRDRLDELIKEEPNVDFVLAGDFNSDYNQKSRYDFKKTAINDVLKSTGYQLQSMANNEYVLNLWYEYPIENRGSDTYRGYWGTLMQIMVSQGMFVNANGISYVEDSIEKGDFGFNTFASSGEPKRWSSTFSGSGFSDHLPVSMKFRSNKHTNSEENVPFLIQSLAKNDDDEWKPIPVKYSIPSNFKSEKEFTVSDPTKNSDFYDEYFFLTATVTDKYDFVVNGRTYDVYTPSFKLDKILSGVKGSDKEIKFYGRFSQYRGNWQFIIESPEFLIIQ
ncbi:MAG: hypothetical protein ABJI33_14260 [Balneola sp.]